MKNRIMKKRAKKVFKSISLNDGTYHNILIGESIMTVKELIRELQKLDGELKVFASADMWDVCY